MTDTVVEQVSGAGDEQAPVKQRVRFNPHKRTASWQRHLANERAKRRRQRKLAKKQKK